MSNFTVLVTTALVLAMQGADENKIPNCFDEESKESARFTTTPISEFRELVKGLSREQVLSRVGPPSYECGSGIMYDVYVLEDGRRVSIAYLSGDAAWAEIHDRTTEESEKIFGT